MVFFFISENLKLRFRNKLEEKKKSDHEKILLALYLQFVYFL